jgi:hypothetical protein
MVELGPNFQLRPLRYTLRNGGGTVAACMTGWILEASQSTEGMLFGSVLAPVRLVRSRLDYSNLVIGAP